MIAPAGKKGGLGRGLNALLGPDTPEETNAKPQVASPLQNMPLQNLVAGQYQPRTRMDEGALQELAASIRQHGIMQPITVRAVVGGKYEIIAGERRFRAAAIANLSEVPVIIKEVSDKDALALALIENIQREDLNPLEQAQAIKRLIDEFAFTHDQAAESIGRSRSATSNLLRLLNLATPVQTMLLAGDLDMGHARALLSLSAIDQITYANLILQRKLSVREAEKLVSKVRENDGTIHAKPKLPPTRDTVRLQESLADHLASPVELKLNNKGGGKLVINFSGHESFEGVMQKLGLSHLMGE